MEHCYIIIYDLCSPERDYQSLYTELKRFRHWGKLSESAWAIISEKSATDIRNLLARQLDDNDRLMVILSGQQAAWQNQLASNEWLKANLIK